VIKKGKKQHGAGQQMYEGAMDLEKKGRSKGCKIEWEKPTLTEPEGTDEKRGSKENLRISP